MRDMATSLENDSTTYPNTMSGEVDKGMLPISNEPFLSGDAHDEIQTSQRPVEPEIFLQHANDESNGSLNPGDDSEVSDGVHFEFPQINVHKQLPSVSQLKMALFLESTRLSRGVGAASDFANYWECLERYITLNSHASEMNRSRHDIDATLHSFLKTRKLKRLHNKLVLGEFWPFRLYFLVLCCVQTSHITLCFSNNVGGDERSSFRAPYISARS
jgi:hypothetical protein